MSRRSRLSYEELQRRWLNSPYNRDRQTQQSEARSGMSMISDYYQQRWEQDRFVQAEAEASGAAFGFEPHAYVKLWREQAIAQYKRSNGIAPETGLTAAQQGELHPIIYQIAQRAQAAREAQQEAS